MQKIATYIQTIGSEIFRKFISLPFSINLLDNIINEERINVIFDGWHGKDMGNWCKFTNEEKITLEFYANRYNILNGKTKQVQSVQMPLPKTINDFINDMERFEVALFWNQWMEDNFEPKDYLHADDIPKYFNNLLIKMQKEEDLN